MKVTIEDIYTASRVKVFTLDGSIPLEGQIACPACGNDLRPVCLFSNSKGTKEVRYGLCLFCGYSGYMDRPAKEWMIDFYSRKWDKKSPRSKEDVVKSLNLPKQGPKAGRWLTFSLAGKFEIDKERPVCEIGCGYGEVLKNFERTGFKNLIGVEHSEHRADFVRKNFGFTVLNGEFENPGVQSRLRGFKPISVFFSHHVLEHTYNPAEIISLASSLQDVGDHLFLSVPDAAGEHINYVLFYLVHLHSFTKESLEFLLNRNGYEIVADNSPDSANMIVAARKTAAPQPRFRLGDRYFNGFMERVKNGLALDEIGDNRLYRLDWRQEPDRPDSRSWKAAKPLNWKLSKLVASAKALFGRFSPGYSMLIRATGPNNEAPLEVKFRDDIRFLVK